MADFAEIARQRARLRMHNDYLRLRLSAHYERLRPTSVRIEQGYYLAQALANNQEHPIPWIGRIIAILRGK